MKVYKNLYPQIISPDNLFFAWEEFQRGKTSKADVIKFEWQLEENIFQLHNDLQNGDYRHGNYQAFYITDPKQRLIHKALVRDRILHHAVFKKLNPIFEPTFIANSFSCRVDKGTHRGVKALAKMLRQVSRNHTRPCYTLKCDIHRFFASVDHKILIDILKRRVQDRRVLKLLSEIINSFHTANRPDKGLPIGNLTSQLFANIYMNEFDQFVKHQLKIKYYARYTDDFVIVGANKGYLGSLIPKFEDFLETNLKLELHPSKLIIRKYSAGIDFLGYIIFPHRVLIRTKTKKRMLQKINKNNLPSYLGVCSHANSFKLQIILLTELW